MAVMLMDLSRWDWGTELVALADAIERALGRLPLCESPVERQFLKGWCDCDWPVLANEIFGELLPQHKVQLGGKGYRLDFAIVPLRLAIEIDGIEWHSEAERFVADLERQRALQDGGWTVYRFTGRDVHRDAQKCAARAVRFASALLRTYGER